MVARRRTRVTACRPCRSWPSTSTVSTGSSANHPWSSRSRELPRTAGMSKERRDRRDGPRAVPRRPLNRRLQDDRRHLLERFEVVDIARKLVGVGSVGTQAFIVLLQGRDQQDPLFLQVKEATESVLEDHLSERVATASRENASCKANG